MEITFRGHPAQARHPVTQELLWNKDGTHVPLVLDQKAVYLDGIMVGYCKSDGSWLATTVFLQPPVYQAVQEAMVAYFGSAPKKTNQVPEPEPLPVEPEPEATDSDLGEDPLGSSVHYG